MKKAELEAKLNEINESLRLLGDLNSFATQAKETSSQAKNLLDSTQEVKTQIEQFSADIDKKKQDIESVAHTASEYQTVIERQKEMISGLEKKHQELIQKNEEIKKETESQLGIISNEKLANSFATEATKLEIEKSKWFWYFFGASITLALVVVGIIVWQVVHEGTLFSLSFLSRIPISAPFIYFVVFANLQFGRTRNLIEEYTFKASVARSFEAYRLIIEGAFADDEKIGNTAKLEFIIAAIKDLYSSPMRNIKEHSSDEKSLNLSMLEKIAEIFKKIIIKE